MPIPVLMPRLSPTMEEGVISAWLKKEGDKIKNAEALCEIETDKASMEYEAPDAGVIVKLLVETGITIKVDTVIAIIADAGEKVDVDLFLASLNKSAPAKTVTKSEEKHASQASSVAPAATTSNDRVKASPLAKSIAKDKNINLQNVAGTGTNGRIISKDLASVKPITSSAPKKVMVSSSGTYQDIKNSTMRNVIAKRLLESSQGAPEFFLTMEIQMDNAIALRNQIKETMPDLKITFNDMVIKATALALVKNPKCNAYWLGDSIRILNDIHISVAVAIEDGLITPVIRNADKLDLADISAQVKDLAARAKNKKLQPEEYTGGTFSVSNLGMFGIEQFTSILNPPESGIFAIGGISEKVIGKNGVPHVANIMKITMTCDHRVIDGATGAQLLVDVKKLLENPASLVF